MDLLLMRHAETSGQGGGPADFERPLTRRGWLDADRIAAVLVESELIPARILVSPALRTRETVERMLERFGKVKVKLVKELYGASPSTILQSIEKHGKGATPLLVLAHNPGMEMLVSSIADSRVPFSTGTVAHVKREAGEMPTLMSVWRPQELPAG